MPILTTHNLAVGYNAASPVLSSVNVELRRGELIALLGPNGIGKSTLLRTLSGVQTPLEGNIFVDKVDMMHLSRRQRALNVAMVMTDRTLAGGLTVRELVSLGRQPHTGFLGHLSSSDCAAVDRAMEVVSIAHKSECRIGQLSDGERQKAMIARALAQATPIIILDEPTAFLDVASRIEILTLLGRLTHEQNIAVLLSTHDVSHTLPIADELWLATREGRVAAGAKDEMIKSEQMSGLFDGDDRHPVRFDPVRGDFVANS